MNMIRVAATTANLTPLDWKGNSKIILEVIESAKKQGTQLVCLPELTLSGYGCEDTFLSPYTSRLALESLKGIIPHTKDIAVTIGLPFFFEGLVYNAVAMLQNEKVLGLILKKQLPREGVHYEPRWFKAWEYGRSETIALLGQKVTLATSTLSLAVFK